MKEQTVTAEQLPEIRRELDAFLSLFDDCIRTAPSREHFYAYVKGQTSKLERKSIEPMALEAGIAPRSLQEFLSIHRWRAENLRDRLQELVKMRHARGNAIGIIDETGIAKKGDKTPGVQHQYCGSTGKTDNCVVTVQLGYATENFASLLDGDLYLPESWNLDRKRCQQARIPDTVTYRPKWQIALDLIDQSLRNGLQFSFITADEFYGRGAPFREGLDQRDLQYVLEVPCDLHGWSKPPLLMEGRRGKQYLAPGEPEARRVDQVWLRGGPSWKAYHIKDTEKGPVVWEARAVRFFPRRGGLPDSEGWLLAARHVLTGERKYFLSNAAADTPIPALLHVAFARARIEELFETAKGDAGYDHFEVRNYQSLMKHLAITNVSLLYLMEEAERLRKKKSLVESQPGARSGGSAA